MAINKLFLLALATLVAVALASEAQKIEAVEENHNRAGKSQFEYDQNAKNGPSNWGSISPDFSICNKGHHQSPINLVLNESTADGLMPEVSLNESVVEYAPSGGNFVLNCKSGTGREHCSTITYYGERYHMIQAHFHSPSEHHIDGKEFPLEMHLVHTSENGDALLVLGILFEVGNFNEDVQKLLDSAIKMNKQVVDFPHFVQPGAGLCTYEGSLTTPPCTEGVHWLISNTVIQASLKQVGMYREMVNETLNDRPVQSYPDPQTKCYLNPTFTGGIAKRRIRSIPGSRSGVISNNARDNSTNSDDSESETTSLTNEQPSSDHSGSSGSTTDKDHGDSSHSGSSGSTTDKDNGDSSHSGPSEPTMGEDSNDNSDDPDSEEVISPIALASPNPGPLPSNSSSGNGNACFTADARVRLANGDTVRMDELRIGDEVSVGACKFSQVVLFTHRDELAVTTHVQISTASGKTLTLSPGHYLRANGELVAAEKVRVGDHLLGEHSTSEKVILITQVQGVGLFNPQTVSGEIAVEGIVCSTYTTAVKQNPAHALLAPVRTMFRMGGVTEKTAGRFLVQGASDWIV